MPEKNYRKEFAVAMSALVANGIGQEDAARLLEIAPETLRRWSMRHPEFREALRTPCAAERAEAALLKRALGFRQEEASSEELVDKKSGELLEVLKRRVITKEVPPDVRALLFWLKNRCPERWCERPDDSEDFRYDPPAEEAGL